MRSRPSARALVGGIGLIAVVAAAIPTAVLAANPEGVLDPSFGGGDGKVEVALGTAAGASDGVVLADGRIVVTGSWYTGTHNELFVMRLTASGAPDTTFSGDGIYRQAVATESYGKRILVQPDGKILVLGEADPDAVVMRLTASGVLDTTFAGGAGFFVSKMGAALDSNGDAFALQPDGKILVGGEADQTATTSDAYVARFTGAGALDSGFGVGGIRTINLDQYDWLQDFGLQSDGTIIAVGGSADASTNQVLVARLTTSGALDATYNATGTYRVDVGGNAAGYRVAIDRFERAVVLAPNGSNDMLRLTTGGQPDATFSGDGFVAGAPTDALAFQANGRILVGGHDSTVARMVRYDEWGNIDASFGTNGTTTTDVTAGQDRPRSIHVGGTGRITVVGYASTADAETYLARYIGDATAPFGARLLGLPAVSTATTRALAWTASDDNTGISSYSVRYRSAAYSSSTLGSAVTWKSNTASASGSFAAGAGKTYCFQVRATDVAGNVGPYGPQQCVAVPVNDRTMSRAGSWSSVSSSSYYKGTASSSTSSGATLKLGSVRYRRLALVATTCAGCGSVKVYLGSTLLKTVSLASSTTKHKVVITVDVSAAARSGTITIKQASGGRKTVIEGLAVALY